MKRFAIIGLGTFGRRMLEKLSDMAVELVLVDRDPAAVERHKDQALSAYVADALDESVLRRMLPDNIDVAIVDVGSRIESAILIVNGLKKLGVPEIVVRADSEERGEVLGIVGATKVVFPEKEAASRIVPMLVSPSLFSFMPLGSSLVIAEVRAPESVVGKTLVEANLRQRFGVNVIALRSEGSEEYRYFAPDYRICPEDVLLVAAKEKDMIAFSGIPETGRKGGIAELFKRMLKGKLRRET